MSEPAGAKAVGLAKACLVLTVVLSVPLGYMYLRMEKSGVGENYGLMLYGWALILVWYSGTFASLIASSVAASKSQGTESILFISLAMLVVPPIVACIL